MTTRPLPPAFHMLTKPTGAVCNLDCEYCFFLAKERLYPGSRFRMADDLLELYIKQLIEGQQVNEVAIAWQGGEPTMMGLDFFKRSIELQEKYRKPGMTIANSMQTNGTLIDDEWAAFLKENNFLIGISIDGPPHLHDRYRVDKGGQPSSGRVLRGLEALKRHKVDFNILCTVHAANGDHPVEVYKYFRDELGAEFMQFIPIVERDNDTGYQEGSTVTNRSVGAEQYGRFLSSVFDEWVRRDVGKVYVQIFDVALGAWTGMQASLCIFGETCGLSLAMEHTGDIYSCDHFVEPDYLLGNIRETDMIELVASDQQYKFGQDKRDTLPEYCRQCDVRFMCNGGCPKNRFITTPDGEDGLNYLCEGYKLFFHHIDTPMRIMADLLRRQRPPADIMTILAQQEAQFQATLAKAGRNDPCPCGSGRKFKHCHGKRG